MIAIVILLSTTLTLSHAASRYIVHEYAIPLSDPGLVAYPLDICVNYEVVLDVSIAPVPKRSLYAIFSCNDAEDAVSFQAYTDENCDVVDGDAITVSDSSAAAGTLGAFNCVGANNYVAIDSCTSVADPDATTPEAGADVGEACCNSFLCGAQTFATGVCVYVAKDTGDKYHITSCDEFETTTESHLDDACSDGDEDDRNEGDVCAFFTSSFGYDVTRRMLDCVRDSSVISNNTYYCSPTAAPSAAPTMEPTMATGAPTGSPSTPVTTNDDGDDDDDDDSKANTVTYVIGCVLALMTAVGYMVN